MKKPKFPYATPPGNFCVMCERRIKVGPAHPNWFSLYSWDNAFVGYSHYECPNVEPPPDKDKDKIRV